MSFDRNTSNQSEPPKRSIWSTMFVPDITGGMSGIGESLQMFVKIIAYLFALNGLFPKEHPALQPRATRSLRLMDVLATGWSNLVFKKENMIQIIVYFSVIGTLFLAAALVLSLCSSLLIGTAHASETSMFTPPNKEQDLAHNILAYLFKNEEMNITVANFDGNGTLPMPPQPHVIQAALLTTMAYYSTAILVFAGIILMYHLVVMIAETAHSGVPMGRNANQVWAPIRLVFAIGLLVPISGGLNTGQYIAVQIADWGSGLASNIWKTYLDALAQNQNKFFSPPLGAVGPVVRGKILSYACMRIYNKIMEATPDDSDIVIGSPEKSGDALNYTYTYGTNAIHELCGQYSIPNPTKYTDAQTQNLLNGAVSAYEDLVINDGADAKIDDYVNYFIQGREEYGKISMDSNAFFHDEVKAYRTSLETKINNAYQSETATYDSLATKWSALGWYAAMAFTPVISHAQQTAVNNATLVIPNVRLPVILQSSRPAGGNLNAIQETTVALKNFARWLDGGYSKTAQLTEQDYNTMYLDAGHGKAPLIIGRSNGIVKIVMKLAGMVARNYEIFRPDFGMLTVGKTGDPFAEVANFGHRNIVAAFDVLDIAVEWAGPLSIASVAGKTLSEVADSSEKASDTARNFKAAGLMASSTAGQVASTIMSVAGMFATLLFTTGLMCGYFVPLVPFATFFFNILAWIVSVFEAVISMPLLALAHLTTKGEGLPGDMAKQGYFFLFSIFLRPPLMVFGLIAGLLIFYVAVFILNATYSIAVRGVYPDYVSGGNADPQTIDAYNSIARAVFNVIYGMFVYICATTAFNTIKFFPDHAMRWMSSQGVSTERMGDKQLMSSAMTGITAYAFKDTVSSTVGQNPGLTLVGKGANGAVDGVGNAFSSGGRNANAQPQLTTYDRREQMQQDAAKWRSSGGRNQPPTATPALPKTNESEENHKSVGEIDPNALSDYNRTSVGEVFGGLHDQPASAQNKKKGENEADNKETQAAAPSAGSSSNASNPFIADSDKSKGDNNKNSRHIIPDDGTKKG